jgi:hypothetical protein
MHGRRIVIPLRNDSASNKKKTEESTDFSFERRDSFVKSYSGSMEMAAEDRFKSVRLVSETIASKIWTEVSSLWNNLEIMSDTSCDNVAELGTCTLVAQGNSFAHTAS